MDHHGIPRKIKRAVWGISLMALAFSIAIAEIAAGQAPATPPPAQPFNCQVELGKLQAYAAILKADRDQKEAALAEYGSQLRALTAEINALKAPKETK